MKAYKTTLHASSDGKATIGVAYYWSRQYHAYIHVGTTNAYKTYPASVRARSAANNLCKKHCRVVHGNARNIDISEQ